MRTYQCLGYLGLIPFIILLWLSIYPQEHLLSYPAQVFVYYSVAILSFLSGTLWKKGHISSDIKSLIFSNFFCLYAFLCLLLPVADALFLLPIGYIALFFVEFVLYKNKADVFFYTYMVMRVLLTSLVSLLHVLLLYYGVFK